MKLDELKEHCLKTLKQTEKFPTKTFEEHALVLQLIRNQESTISRLEKVKEKIFNKQDEFIHSNLLSDCSVRYSLEIAEIIIDKEIAELKGENNEQTR